MIVEFCRRLGSELDPEPSRPAMIRNRAVLEREELPLGWRPEQIQAVLWSSLFARCRESAERRLPSGVAVPRLSRVQAPSSAEYARLISKGRLLYEHCMTEVSHACMVGFIDHELKKSRTAERVMLDLLGWIVEQRFEFADLEGEEGDEALRRVAHTDYILDLGVSLLHGLDRAQALELAADREPLD